MARLEEEVCFHGQLNLQTLPFSIFIDGGDWKTLFLKHPLLRRKTWFNELKTLYSAFQGPNLEI